MHARAIADDPNKDDPAIGSGTVQNYKDGDNTLSRFNVDLGWKGDARDAATYYIVVEPKGSTPADYQLSTTFTQKVRPTAPLHQMAYDIRRGAACGTALL